MIKMQVKQIWQARCPYCGKVSHVQKKEEEIYCHCDEERAYFKVADNG